MQKKIISSNFSFFLIFLTIYIIFISDTILFGTNRDGIFIVISRLSPIFFSFIYIILFLKKSLSKSNFVCLIFCIISILLSVISNNQLFSYYYISAIFNLIFAFFFATKYSLEKFSKYYINIILVISISSLLVELFKLSIVNNFQLVTLFNSNNLQFKFLFLTNISVNDLYTLFTRNFGPFWEPGAFQFYLIIAIILITFVKNYHNFFYFKLFVITFTLLTTGSGIALFSLFFVFLAFIFNSKSRITFISISILFLIFTMLISSSSLFSSIVNKTFDFESLSFQIRLFSILGNFYGFLNSPIFGLSPLDSYFYRKEIFGLFTNINYYESTNTLPMFFSLFGIFVGLFYSSNMFNMLKSISQNIFVTVFLFLSIFLSSSNVNLTNSLFFTSLLFLRAKTL